jgi:hypothetical protein
MGSERTLKSSVRTSAAPLQVNLLRYPTANNMRKWLKAHDPSINHKLARDICVEGTGSWLPKDERFRKWLNKSGIKLWIAGPREYSPCCAVRTVLRSIHKAGFGKTVLL